MKLVLNPRVKTALIYAAKNAVNAILVEIMAGKVHFHGYSHAELISTLRLFAEVVGAREAMVWGPKLLKWSQTDNGG